MYSLAFDSWDNLEIEALQKVISSGRYTMGDEVEKFEKEFSNYVGSKNAVMTNSGSSANLIGLTGLVQNPNYNLFPGDEVIVPAVSWSTTYFPVAQNNLILKFVDVDRNTLNIDTDLIEKSISKKTKAIFAVNLLGNSCYLSRLKEICESYNLILIEDNCESFGAKYNNKCCGTWGSIGTFSFFFSHHLQTMEGGMVVTDDDELADYLRSIRSHGWVRGLSKNNSLYKTTGNSFQDSFTFVLPGYCVRPLEMSGAVGRIQLQKSSTMLEKRIANAKCYHELFDNFEHLQTQRPIPNSIHSYFGFSFILQNRLINRRQSVVETLSKNSIESRPIVAGNFLRNPVISKLKYVSSEPIIIADDIHDNGFFLGNDSRDLCENLSKVKKILEDLI